MTKFIYKPKGKAQAFAEVITLLIMPRKTREMKNNHQFKPFDKVLCRFDTEDSVWRPRFFSHIRQDAFPYCTIGGACFDFCIPYEGNEDLAFTTKSSKINR